MRLNHRNHLAFYNRARRLEDRAYLNRVMSVIVNHGHPVPLAGLGKTSLYPAEIAQRRPQCFVAQSHCLGDRDGGQRILDVMLAEHRQKQLGNGPRAAGESGGYDGFEPRPVTIEPEVDGADVSLRAEAIGQQAPVREFREHPLHDRMINAQRGKAVERDVLHKALEGIAHTVERAVIVEVIGIDVGNDSDGCGQAQERAVAFVRFDDNPVARAEPRVRPISIDDAAVHHRRIETSGVEQRRNERCRRGLAIRAGDRNALLEPHDFGQHLGASHERQFSRTRRFELDVAGLHG